LEDEQALQSLEVKHWRFYGHITTVEAELELALVRPSFQERLMERTEDEAITDFSVREAKLLERLREHDKVCRGCEKPTERTEEGIRAGLEAMASCM
jgi:N12 class adenine-specific DNA methylase